MDPAAPETNTTLSFTSRCTIGLSIIIGALSNKSSILICLIWFAFKSPSIHLDNGGTILTSTSKSINLSVIANNLLGLIF